MIKQNNNKLYTVYSGETADLKARAREHDCGSNTTYCLCLSQYEVFNKYEWYFCFLPVSSLGNNYKDDKILRIVVEQGFRAKQGWPILYKG